MRPKVQGRIRLGPAESSGEMAAMGTEHKRPSHRALSWGIGVVVFLMLYVLSIGPVLCIMIKGEIQADSHAGKTVWGAYAPVTWVIEKNETAEAALGEYLFWWMRITGNELNGDFDF